MSVRIDAPVVAWGGAVGRVVYVDASHAKVLMLCDRGAGAAGIVQRSGAEGFVRGQGEGPLEYRGKPVRSVAYVYCVGARCESNVHGYCSRYCCNAAMHAALVAGPSTSSESQQLYYLVRWLT